MPIAIADVLNLPVMQNATLIAGHNGLHHPIRWVTIVEVIEDVTRLQEGEFLLTTGYGWESDPEKGKRLIKEFAARKLSGVAVLTGFYLTSVPNQLIELANYLELPIFEFPPHINFSMVTQEILELIVNEQFRLLTYSEEVQRKLVNLALSSDGLPAIAQELSILTSGDIHIYDLQWHPITHSTLRYFGDHDEVKRLAMIEVTHEKNTSFLYEMTELGQQSTNYITVSPVTAHQEVLGYMALVKASHPSELDRLALGHACTVCALDLIKERAILQTTQRLQADFLDELLQNRFQDSLSQIERASTFGLDEKKYHTVAIIQLTDNPMPSEVNSVSLLVQRVLKDHQILSLLKSGTNSLLLLIEHIKSDQPNKVMQEIFQKLQSEFKINIGIGIPRKSLSAIHLSAKEAQMATRYGTILHDYQGISTYSDLTPYAVLIDMLEQGISLSPYYQPILTPILDKTYLLETLEVLIWTNLNIKEASDQLYIHRHTLTYRLKKIEQATGRKLSNANDRFALQTAIIARKAAMTDRSSFHRLYDSI